MEVFDNQEYEKNNMTENENEPIGLSTEEIQEILLNTREQGQMFESLIRNQIDVKDGLIDKLHKELEFYKQGTADKYTDQLMKAVIKIRKDMLRRMNSDEWADYSVDDLKREFQYVMEDITDLLEQQNIDPFQTEPGEAFNASKHQAKVEITDEES
jgi:molecular chaperone GrpE (heat shock protein)